jgi:uncharacterized protein YbjT (DUF2867 family)
MIAEGHEVQNVVVLGASGLIGSACLRALKANGFRTTAVGRSKSGARRSDPDTTWIFRDIATTEPADWAEILKGVDVVVNASGALQNGVRDNLGAIHEGALANLVSALEGKPTRFIQISAAGVSANAPTEFFRSKMRGDRLLMQSTLDWVILRPTLVIGPEAYGGTALLRAAASFPLRFPKALASRPMQTVSIFDVAGAVVQAARGEIASGIVADLTEPGQRSFAETIDAIRKWQGFPPWRSQLPVPAFLMRFVALGADALGWLGWRSPLRTTAIRTLEKGVTGDPANWRAAGGQPCRGLSDTLAEMPATAQERWFARLYLLLPLAITTLSLFWIASGLIGLARSDVAQALLMDRGAPHLLAALVVVGGSVADIILGAAVLIRKWARPACLGMVAVSVLYLLGGTVFAPDLWTDPLGPLLKVLPAIVLALTAAALLDER